MKQFAVVGLALATLVLTGCDDGPNDPDTDTVVFTASLSAANEVPAVTGPEAGATGAMTITMEVTRDSSDNITAAEANFSGSVAGMPAGSSLVMSHIHTGAAGANGGIVVDTGLLPASPIAIVNGSATLTFGDRTVTAAVAQQILDNPAAFYFNVHSALNTGGVVRGQLARQ